MVVMVGAAILGQVLSYPAQARDVTITIGTGRVGGLYHPVGGAICKLVNEGRRDHGITCTIDITSGSITNIRDLRRGEVDLAMSQSDWQHDAVIGSGPFEKDAPFSGMRSVFAVYVEHFTIVARQNADILSFQDLQGKRVFVGGPGSGRRQTMNVLMEAHGWFEDDLTALSEFEADSLSEALCDNEFDAYIYTIGHPNPSVREAFTTCNAVLVPVTGPAVDQLVAENPFYVSSVIPQGTYDAVSRNIPGFGLVATLLTTEDADPDVIYAVTKAFFDNLDRLRAETPLFDSIRPANRPRRGLSAPLHEGARRFFDSAELE